MTFVLDALRDKPQGLFQMDDDSPFRDYSGYGRTATLDGGLTKHAGLVKGAAYAPVLSSAVNATFASTVFRQNEEESAFTLVGWFRVLTDDGEQQVLGNDGQMDGLTVDGSTVSFVVKYTAAPEVRLSYDVGHSQTIAAWAIHTESKHSLYVNGILVDEAEITNEQQNDTFASTSNTLASGDTAGGSTLAVNGIATYNYALNPSVIERQYRAGKGLPTNENIVTSFGGTIIPVSMLNVDTFLNFNWTTDEQWNLGNLSNVVVVEGEVIPQFEADTSIPGGWYDSVAVVAADSVAIYGIVVEWEGKGVTIEVSLDGDTWESVTRGKKVDLIPQGFDPTDEVLLIRATFPGGIVDDDSYLSSLNVVGISSSTGQVDSGRTVSYDGATPQHDYDTLDMTDDWGVNIETGGSITISAHADDIPVRTIEIWAKPDADTSYTPGAAATNTYQNGVSGTTTLKGGHWTLYHRVLNADLDGEVVIDVPGQIGHVAFYPTALTTPQVAGIYAAYTGTNVAQVNDSSVIGITESPQAADIYAYDWSISGAG